MAPVQMDIGLCFSFLDTKRVPTPVVHVWFNDEPRRLLAVWPVPTLERRLAELRDAHRDLLKQERKEKWAWRLSREDWWAGGPNDIDGDSDDDPVRGSDVEDSSAGSSAAVSAAATTAEF